MEVSAGIILFNPDIDRLQENISAIIGQCNHIYFIDNGSSNIIFISNLLQKYAKSKITLIRNSKNEGIAKALNQVAAAAEKDGADWVLTLDQDSVVPDNMIREYKKYTNIQNSGIICPIIYDRNKKEKIKTESGYKEINQCITSGSMLSIRAWNKVGGFDESMFIDGVDFDMCYRLRNAGYRIICVQNVILLHELGHIQKRRFLIWNVVVKNHSSFRKYYIARNTIYLARKKRNFSTTIKAYLQVLKQAGIVLLYEKQKKDKLIMICKGAQAGRKALIQYDLQ